MKPRSAEAKNPFELIEESFYLLRSDPAALVAYYLGSFPFILGLLFYWSDMARSAFAVQRLLPGSIALTAAFVWMKTWQTVFARNLHARLCGEPAPRWTLSRVGRVAAHQAFLQAAGLFLLPLAFALMLPFGWAYALATNLTVLGAPDIAEARMLGQRAWRQALLWPGQNHQLLGLFGIFSFFVFCNLYTGLLGLPFLLDRFLGIESIFTRAPWAAMNSTATAGVAALTYLCCDPVVKATYVLRCYYGESLRTGQDLRAELRRFGTAARALAVALLFLAVSALSAPGAELAPDSTVAPPLRQAAVSSPALRESIERVIRQREYSWRLPRDSAAAAKAASPPSWVEWIRTQVLAIGRSIRDWLADMIQWLRGLWSQSGAPSGSGSLFSFALSSLMVLLSVSLLGLLAWVLLRLWRDRDRTVAFAAKAMTPAPDVADENVGADRLPEEGWRQLARELGERGEWRLAVRALYLATLAQLAERNLIVLARFKSNRDYERELLRRGHALPSLVDLFAQNLGVFERIWYGVHEATPNMLEEFAANVEGMRNA